MNDLVQLPTPGDDAVCDALQRRHLAGEAYTMCGAVCIFLTPTTSSLSGVAAADCDRSEPQSQLCAFVDRVRAVALLGDAQAILITGESGAGKTRQVRACLAYR